MSCRSCRLNSLISILDLKAQPLSNAYLTQAQLSEVELTYPLSLKVCTCCWLVQLGEFASPKEIFEDYAYFSSQSQTWLDHCKKYAEDIQQRFNPQSVLELASNDGALLQYFNIERLGVEPAKNVADQAQQKGIPTFNAFFTEKLAKAFGFKYDKFDLVVANNVLAHVPDLNDFIAGIKHILSADGLVTIEVPSLRHMIEEVQFDTIYHEHFSYFSLTSLSRALARHKLKLIHVEELPTHGGSFRLYLIHEPEIPNYIPEKYRIEAASNNLTKLWIKEQQKGVAKLDYYLNFSHQVWKFKREITKYLMDIKARGLSIAAYGAPAKGNTLLNYCGLGTDIFDYVVDTTPYKQGRYLPGSRILIYSEDMLYETKPDVIYIQPWNWYNEISEKLRTKIDWKTTLVTKHNNEIRTDALLP